MTLDQHPPVGADAGQSTSPPSLDDVGIVDLRADGFGCAGCVLHYALTRHRKWAFGGLASVWVTALPLHKPRKEWQTGEIELDGGPSQFVVLQIGTFGQSRATGNWARSSVG